jgi:3-oxoacyl-[acyl-carrier protein] reductase
VSDVDWFGTFELNVMSAVRASRAPAPKMAERGWGRIINVSSESGVQPDPIAVEYAAAKGALNALTKALSKAYGGRGVLVNVVSPAYIDTPIVRSLLSQMPGGDELAPDQLAQQYLGSFRPNIVVGRPGRSEEVAAAVVFLASDAASSPAPTSAWTAARWRRSDYSVHHGRLEPSRLADRDSGKRTPRPAARQSLEKDSPARSGA